VYEAMTEPDPEPEPKQEQELETIAPKGKGSRKRKGAEEAAAAQPVTATVEVVAPDETQATAPMAEPAMPKESPKKLIEASLKEVLQSAASEIDTMAATKEAVAEVKKKLKLQKAAIMAAAPSSPTMDSAIVPNLPAAKSTLTLPGRADSKNPTRKFNEAVAATAAAMKLAVRTPSQAKPAMSLSTLAKQKERLLTSQKQAQQQKNHETLPVEPAAASRPAEQPPTAEPESEPAPQVPVEVKATPEKASTVSALAPPPAVSIFPSKKTLEESGRESLVIWLLSEALMDLSCRYDRKAP